jgi:hypothetical protein
VGRDLSKTACREMRLITLNLLTIEDAIYAPFTTLTSRLWASGASNVARRENETEVFRYVQPY